MRNIRIIVGGAGDPGGSGRRRIGLWLLTALALPILIVAGVGYGVYHAFFRVPEFRALLFEGGRVARGAVVPLADGAVVLSQENAQPPYRVAFGAGTVTRVWPGQSLSNCQNIGGKIVCTR
jgi:hypothetical protein